MKRSGLLMGLLLMVCACSRKAEVHIVCERATDMSDPVMAAFQVSPDSAYRMIDECQSDWAKEDSVAYYLLENTRANLYYYAYQDEEVELLNHEIRAFCERSDSSGWLNTLKGLNDNRIGVGFQLRNEQDSALRYYREAYDALMVAEDRVQIPNVCINLGNLYMKMGKYTCAAQWNRRALVLVDSMGLDGLHHSISVNLGETYTQIGNYEEAHKFYLMAAGEYAPRSDYEMFVYRVSYGNFYFFQQDYAHSLKQMKMAYGVASRLGDPSLLSLATGNMADNYLNLGELDSAEVYLGLAQENLAQEKYVDDAKEFYVNGLWAQLYLLRKEYGEAEPYLNREFDEERVGPIYLSIYHKRLADYYAGVGNYERAFVCHREYSEYEDSLRSVKHLNYVSEVYARYKRDTTILNQQYEIKSARVALVHHRFWLGVVVMFAVLLLVFLLWYDGRTKRKRKEAYDRNVERLVRLRVEANGSRLSSHFIMNVLNTIVPDMGRDELMKHKVDCLIELFRLGLTREEGLVCSLVRELDMVRNYAELCRAVDNRLPKVTYDVDDGVDMGLMVPVMAIQTAVENALKYAFTDDHLKSDVNRWIVVRVYWKNDTNLVLEVVDNGVGCLSHQWKHIGRGTGKGMELLRRTIDLLNVKRDKLITYELLDLSQVMVGQHGTQMIITIPKDML